MSTGESSTETHRHEFLLEYFKSLREENLLAQKNRFNIVVWKLGTMSFLLGTFVKSAPDNPDLSAVIPRAMPLLGLLFHFMYFEEVNRGIMRVGDFICEVVEKAWFPYEDKVLWESHLRDPKRNPSGGITALPISTAMLIMTAIVAIYGMTVTGDLGLAIQDLPEGITDTWVLYWAIFVLGFLLCLHARPRRGRTNRDTVAQHEMKAKVSLAKVSVDVTKDGAVRGVEVRPRGPRRKVRR